ncbi:DUF1707 domain-containing protein [Kitasatospora sp. CB02891]|uniref:DUF1707 SHOCT-like domain-containing protein n=1 Tax=Kitasatospora sp. CB02891 TaxID=2020329 RepID=UPI0018E272C0|nr:DUF1707 domain-containing protein [Kitasatospora sp. CB02891]
MPGEIAPAEKPSGLNSQPEMRASHADRDRVADVLRVAAGDGRLTAEELDQRLEVALSARTVRELAELTVDLPAVSFAADGVVAEAKEVLRIEQKWRPVKRTGRWVVPRRLVLDVEWCAVTLDLTEAVITQDTLQIDVDMRGKTLTLIVGPDTVVDTDGLMLQHSRVRNRASDAAAPTTLRVELVGEKQFGRVVVRRPRRALGRRR